MSKVYTEAKFDLSKLDLSKYKRVVVAEFADAGKNAEEIAKRNAPTNKGTYAGSHRQMIVGSGGEENGQAVMRLKAQSKYAAYLEFGTGHFAAEYVATLPQDLQEYAMQFYVNGKGRLPAHPHIVPAFRQAVKELREHLKAYKK